ncbi:MAG: 3' terminal RNA ribose 2'-O-methyltransferase Hen1 [Deltaproteobacteria bacterium]|nr:3' terminal RNA ribose 2'-O-methyltransferase Hen1 [Deltaproteobacteria bacterium]
MLIKLTAQGPQAGQLGFLLHKHPNTVLERDFSAGRFLVFYPQVGDDHMTVSLLIQVDVVSLARSFNDLTASYIDHRPYAASSLTAVALREAMDSALLGKCPSNPELVMTPMPIRVELYSVVCRGTERLLRELFEPLGYSLTVQQVQFRSPWLKDESSPVFEVILTGTQTVKHVLQHLYVLLPLMERGKHYFVDQSEIEKLLRHGGEWLDQHPRRDWIVARYLFYRRDLIEQALERLTPLDKMDDSEEQNHEDKLEQPIRLREERMQTALAVLRNLVPPVVKIGDLGCGEGQFIKLLMEQRAFDQVVGLDVSSKALHVAARRLRLEKHREWQRPQVQLLHGSLIYQDERLRALDTLALLEVIEHIDEDKLDLVTHNLFEYLSPAHVLLTTPNHEYNSLFEDLEPGIFRHPDHRFEWTREQFRTWTDSICAQYPYTVSHLSVGPVDSVAGAPTQLAVLTRRTAE